MDTRTINIQHNIETAERTEMYLLWIILILLISVAFGVLAFIVNEFKYLYGTLFSVFVAVLVYGVLLIKNNVE